METRNDSTKINELPHPDTVSIMVAVANKPHASRMGYGIVAKDFQGKVKLVWPLVDFSKVRGVLLKRSHTFCTRQSENGRLE